MDFPLGLLTVIFILSAFSVTQSSSDEIITSSKFASLLQLGFSRFPIRDEHFVVCPVFVTPRIIDS